MIYLLICIVFLLLTALTIILTARIVFRAGHNQEETYFRLTVLSCGVLYDISQNRIALLLGGWKKYFKLSGGKKKKSKAKKIKPPAEKKAARKRSLRNLSWAARIKIVKALVLYAGRFLVRIKYEEAHLAARPVIADPALAGMAYGFGTALHGIFPGLRRTFDVYPDFAAEKSRWMGEIAFSIRIRQIIYISCRLIGDLPIKEIIKYWVKRGE